MTVMHGFPSSSVQISCQVGKPLFYRMLGAIDNERHALHCEAPSQASLTPGPCRRYGRPVATSGTDAWVMRRYAGTAERMNVTMESSEDPG